MESFFSRLKVELVYSEDYHSMEDSKSGIFEYIEIFYNRTYIFSFKLNSFWCLQFFNFSSFAIVAGIVFTLWAIVSAIGA
ncbi:IS3 family transposase [Neptunomonas phycophila]|uniref:IS3 family transposase n=1 Tax=Neptunomonas phycophila TaxID=1572645 RepID=UPI001BE8765D|nr:IS3 family transposase [Neptunomonas phycophila]